MTCQFCGSHDHSSSGCYLTSPSDYQPEVSETVEMDARAQRFWAELMALRDPKKRPDGRWEIAA